MLRKMWLYMKHHYMIIILLVFSFINVISINTSASYIYNIYKLDCYQTEALNTSTIYFTFTSDDFVDLSEISNGKIINNATLFQHKPGTGFTYKVLYTQGKKDFLNGQYFQSFDFVSGIPSAIIGYSITDTMGANSTTYSLNGTEYALLGQLDKSIVGAINLSIYYCDCDLNNISTVSEKVFAISSVSKNATRKSYLNLCDFLYQKGIILEEIDYRNVKIDDFINYHAGIITAIIGLIILQILTSTAFLYLWLLSKKTWIRVMRMLGESHLHLRILKDYCLLWVISLCLVSSFLYVFVSNYSFIWNFIIPMSISVLILIVSSSIITMHTIICSKNPNPRRKNT